ncbi:MAG: hypothetical protein JJ902_00420 [Roseibium sp.]|nr:hypothetical protein [Roseibium sp.]
MSVANRNVGRLPQEHCGAYQINRRALAKPQDRQRADLNMTGSPRKTNFQALLQHEPAYPTFIGVFKRTLCAVIKNIAIWGINSLNEKRKHFAWLIGEKYLIGFLYNGFTLYLPDFGIGHLPWSSWTVIRRLNDFAAQISAAGGICTLLIMFLHCSE